MSEQIHLNDVLRRREEIVRIVEAHGASHPRVFGSLARGEAHAGSDVDLLVDIGPGATLFDLAVLRAELERLLGVSVDVVATSGLEGTERDQVLGDAIEL